MVAQERDHSVERIALALEEPTPVIRVTPPWVTVGPKTVGIFTILPPERPGEFLRVSIPIGALVSRAVAGVAAAKHRRQEAAARREVIAALTRFEQQKQVSPR